MKRYRPYSNMMHKNLLQNVECEDGDWCKWEDVSSVIDGYKMLVEAHEKRIADLKEQRSELEAENVRRKETQMNHPYIIKAFQEVCDKFMAKTQDEFNKILEGEIALSDTTLTHPKEMK